MSARTDLEVKRTVYSGKNKNKQVNFGGCENVFNSTYLSFSVPKIDARYSAIVAEWSSVKVSSFCALFQVEIKENARSTNC